MDYGKPIKKPTIGDATNEGVRINWNKMSERIKKCKEDENNKVCRMELKSIGIEFADEN